MKSMATTAAAGLEWALKECAKWMNLDPDEVYVEANTRFHDDDTAPNNVLILQQAKNLGAPISSESIHRYAKKADLTDKTFDEEDSAINDEAPRIPVAGRVTGVKGVSNPAAPPAQGTTPGA